jgi:hypothetical protein
LIRLLTPKNNPFAGITVGPGNLWVAAIFGFFRVNVGATAIMNGEAVLGGELEEIEVR